MKNDQFYFEEELGQRVHRYGHGVHVYPIDRNKQDSLWWSGKEKRWGTPEEFSPYGYQSWAPCKTFKAFKRHCQKHFAEKGLKGYEVVWVNKYIGHDVTFIC